MASEPRVFIGSSSEGRHVAELLQDILTGSSTRTLAWWEPSAFPSGETFMESLQRVLTECNAGLFVATPDDLTLLRDQHLWTARGNVLLEYGMFLGMHGRQRVALAVAGELKLPSDLNGMNVIRLGAIQDLLARSDQPLPAVTEEFKRHNRSLVLDWIGRAKQAPRDAAHELFDLFPRVADVLVDAIRRIRDESGGSARHRDWDLLASDVLEAVAATVDSSNYGMDDGLVENLTRHVLPKCGAIYAVDVLGPRGWVSPRTYRYLAPQIRRYIRANSDEGGVWHLMVTPELKSALERAIHNARSHEALDQSLTNFDNPEYFQWEDSGPSRFEFARILLWSKRELQSAVAEAVIAIHHAFNVPLFFLERPDDHSDRDVDYILFRVGDRIEGFYGMRSHDYATRTITHGRIPGIGAAWPAYHELLQSDDLLFAHDAQYLVLSKR